MLSGIDIEALLGRGDAREPDAGRSKDVTSFLGASKAALRCRSQGATVGASLKPARQSCSSSGLRVCVI